MNAPTELAVIKNTGFSLVPQNLGEAMELAKIIADSDLAPKDYRSKPGNVLIAVQMGAEVGLSPMAAIQSIAVINGKPSLYGDVGKALLLQSGFVIEEDNTEVVKKSGVARCKITRPGHPPCERTFSIDDAKTAGLFKKQGPWTSYPERQMAWRAFWFAARDIAADVLKGLHGAEEVRDFVERDITQQSQRIDPPRDTGPKPYAQADFDKNFPAWEKLIKGGKKNAEQIITMVSSKAVLSDEQKAAINAVIKEEKIVVTYAQVAEKLNAAKDIDVLQADADLIREVADEAQRAELTTLYQQRKTELTKE